jgi:lauroyl/myristoyl acyltransferase
MVLAAVGLAFVTRGSWAGWIRRGLSDALGSLAYVLSREKRHRAERALTAAFGEGLPAARCREIVLRSLRGVWDELLTLVAGPGARAEFDCRITGLRHLEGCLARGRGVILWESNGFGPRWMPKRVLRERGFPLHQVHGSDHLGGLNVAGSEATLARRMIAKPAFDRAERYFAAGLTYLSADTPHTPLRALRRRLTANDIVCIAGDGLLGRQHVAVAFLGATAHFATGMASLARYSGAPLVPMFCVPAGDGRWDLQIEEPITVRRETGRDEAVRQATERFARLLEHEILSHPEHYRNWHLAGPDQDDPGA